MRRAAALLLLPLLFAAVLAMAPLQYGSGTSRAAPGLGLAMLAVALAVAAAWSRRRRED